MAIIVATCAATLSGCSGESNYRADDSTYGIPDNRWATMSYEQREGAREVFRLDELKREEQRKLNTLREEKAHRDAERRARHLDEQTEIERETAQIHRQESRVKIAREKEQAQQKLRERELDALKQTAVRIDR